MEEKEYEVTIREILQRKVRQRAASEEEAQDMVVARYRAGEIVLEADDFLTMNLGAGKFSPCGNRTGRKKHGKKRKYGRLRRRVKKRLRMLVYEVEGRLE